MSHVEHTWAYKGAWVTRHKRDTLSHSPFQGTGFNTKLKMFPFEVELRHRIWCWNCGKPISTMPYWGNSSLTRLWVCTNIVPWHNLTGFDPQSSMLYSKRSHGCYTFLSSLAGQASIWPQEQRCKGKIPNIASAMVYLTNIWQLREQPTAEELLLHFNDPRMPWVICNITCDMLNDMLKLE